MPIWVADYVLASYGTGAIMAVPAHDTRDFEFARQFGLRLVPVVDPGTSVDADAAGEDAGRRRRLHRATARRSTPAPTTACRPPRFKTNIVADLAARGHGPRGGELQTARLALQPAAFLGRAVSDPARAGRRRPADRPACAPCRAERIAGRPARAGRISSRTAAPSRRWSRRRHDWLYVTIDGRRYKRETNTMPQWAGSCWYYLRFLDPKNEQALVDPEIERAWMPVDLYIGGAEHAVLHLLYARFWHKVLFDRGHVSTPEPFQPAGQPGHDPGRDGNHRLSARPTAVGSAPSWSSTGRRRQADRSKRRASRLTPVRVSSRAGRRSRANRFVLAADPAIRLESRAYKMSKSRGNVVNPDEVVKRIRRRLAAAVRNVHGPAGSDQALEHGGRERRARLFGSRLADDRRRAERNARAELRPCRTSRRRSSRTACCTARSRP